MQVQVAMLPDLDVQELVRLMPHMSAAERQELDKLLTAGIGPWLEQIGPQMKAMDSQADIVFYGGQAGGGKTDLLLGLALTQHEKSIIFRREAVQLVGIEERLTVEHPPGMAGEEVQEGACGFHGRGP